MNFKNLPSEVNDYFNSLETFLKSSNLENLLTNEIDHIAVKLFDHDDYQRFVASILDKFEQIYEIDMNGRKISIAKLTDPILVPRKITFLEIMEPKPEKVGKAMVGVEHIEIYFKSLENIEQVLKDHEVSYVLKNNGYHNALVIPINKEQEIKLTDTKIVDVVKAQDAVGLIKRLL